MKNILTQEEIDTIHELCKEYKIINYSINPDGSIDVNGDVYLDNCKLNRIPLKFNTVSGNFNCGFNKLTSLNHCPIKVGISFNCSNNKLTSLKFAPKTIQGYFNCGDNKLTSLEYCPTSIPGGFDCSYNKLTSLEFSPKVVGLTFRCIGNKLTSLKYGPGTVGVSYICSNNVLTSLEYSPNEIKGIFNCYNNDLPDHFINISEPLNGEQMKTFFKYQHDLRIWSNNGYDEQTAIELVEEITDGLK